MVPALTASWRQRSYKPCQDICQQLIPAAQTFSARYCLGEDSLLLLEVAAGLPFERHGWRCLVGEILLIGAAEIPEIETAADSLCCLLASEQYRKENPARDQFSPIQQIHHGASDLAFGSAIYRPEYAGWNDRADVQRLAQYLSSVDPGTWTAADLRHHRELSDLSDRADELEYVRQVYPALRKLYHHAAEKQQIVICETIS